MQWLLEAITRLALPCLIGLLVAGRAIVLLVRWRLGRGLDRSWSWRSSVSEVGAVAGTLPWLVLLLTPTAGEGGLTLIPFRDLTALSTADAATIAVQLVGNLLACAALGFFLPIRFRIGVGTVALVALALSTLVEITQYVLDLGRVTSVDDVIINTAGGTIAALLSRRWWRSRREAEGT